MKITNEKWIKIWLEFHSIVAYARDYINESYDHWKGLEGQNTVFRNLISEHASVRFDNNVWKKFNTDYHEWYSNRIFSPTSDQQEEWMQGYINHAIDQR